MKEINKLQTIVITAAGMLALIILISCLLYSVTCAHAFLPLPKLAENDAAGVDLNTKIITNYKTLSEALQNQRTSVFEKVVTNTLQPVLTTLLTTILAFIFVKGGIQLFQSYLEWKKSTVIES